MAKVTFVPAAQTFRCGLPRSRTADPLLYGMRRRPSHLIQAGTLSAHQPWKVCSRTFTRLPCGMAGPSGPRGRQG
jgi:hypothetical protein